MLSCAHCGFCTLYKQSYRNHLNRIHGVKLEGSSEKNETIPTYCCSLCDYKTGRMFNLTRHEVIKHSGDKEQQEKSLFDRKSHFEQQEKSLFDRKSHFLMLNNVQDQNSNHVCTNCGKSFTRKYGLTQHVTICRGSDPLSCKHCKKEFKTSRSRWNHEQVCTVLDPDLVDSVPDHGHTFPQNQTIQTAETINNTTNNTNNTNNSTTINNVINLVAFPSEGLPEGRLFFVPARDQLKFVQRITDAVRNNSTPMAIQKAILGLLDIPENKVLRKKDLKTGYTYVHTGDGQWEPHLDKQIYPRVIHQSCMDLLDSIHETPDLQKRQNRFAKELDEFGGNVQQFVDDEPDGGMTTGEKSAKKKMRDIERNLKMKAHKDFVKDGLMHAA